MKKELNKVVAAARDLYFTEDKVRQALYLDLLLLELESTVGLLDGEEVVVW